MINPFTILFWSSISAQVVNIAKQYEYAIFYASLGVIIGTASWILLLNLVLHITQQLNYVGGIILLGFSTVEFVKNSLGFLN